jgi:HAD superfamily hydrolase (TIGR01490 family)
MKDYIAFFDLDYTILKTNSGKLIARHAFKNGLFSVHDLIFGGLWSTLHNSGLISPDRVIAKLLQSFENISEEHFIKITNQVFGARIKDTIRENIKAEINSHRKKNGYTVILSAALSYICTQVKDFLGMDDSLCTKLEVIDGYFSGAYDGKYCYGEEKLIQAGNYCKEHNFSLNQAYFYTDSVSDLSLLENVGYPICVAPEPKLARIARRRGWTIFE